MIDCNCSKTDASLYRYLVARYCIWRYKKKARKHMKRRKTTLYIAQGARYV